MSNHGLEYVDIVHSVPLWASVPANDRITEADIRRRHPAPNDYVEAKIQERLALLMSPRCEIATRWLDFNNTKWAPCVYPVAEGEARCKKHGGKSAAKLRQSQTQAAHIRELEREVADLRARLEGGQP